jgi:hypothetical protein
LQNIVAQGQATNNSLPILRGPALYMCSWVPSNLDLEAAGCPVVWNGTRGSNAIGVQPDVDDTVVGSSLGLNLPSSTVSAFNSVISSSVVSSNVISSSTTSKPVPTTTSTRQGPETITIFVPPQPTQIRTGGDLNASRKKETEEDDDEDNEDDEDDDEDDVCTTKIYDLTLLISLQLLFKRSGPQILAFQEAGQIKVNISSMGFENTPATLDTSCLWALNWPVTM